MGHPRQLYKPFLSKSQELSGSRQVEKPERIPGKSTDSASVCRCPKTRTSGFLAFQRPGLSCGECRQEGSRHVYDDNGVGPLFPLTARESAGLVLWWLFIRREMGCSPLVLILQFCTILFNHY